MKVYCFHLKFYFKHNEALNMTFDEVGIDELAGFIRWLQNNCHRNNVILISGASTRSAETINIYLLTVYTLTRHEEYSLHLSEKLTSTVSASSRGFKDFLYHINKAKKSET